MNFFRNYYNQESGIVDVFKTIDFGSILNTDQYQLYQPLDSDNLMTISYNFYKNVDDAWVLYFFNNMHDAIFGVIPQNIVDKSVDYYSDLIINYDTAAAADKLLAQELVREFYFQEMDFDLASKKAIEVLNDVLQRANASFVATIKGFMYEQIVMNEKVSTMLKIPAMPVVFQMKALMNKYSIAWKSN